MYHFYGIIDRAGNRQDAAHRQSIDMIRKKFPSRSASFQLHQKENLTLFGTHIQSVREGNVELFLLGEIYNHAEIIKQAGETISVGSAILNLYLKQGELAFAKLNGSFLIILMDHVSGACKIINDQMGTMQVLYHVQHDFILFASELKFLFCHSRCPRQIDWAAALKRPIPFIVINAERHYDAWFKDINLLEEGTVLEIDPGGKVLTRAYWDPWIALEMQNHSPGNGSGDHNADWYCEAYMDLLDDAVRLRCASKDSAYSMFSGGMDSTIIAALAKKYGDVGTYSFATQATVRDGATEMCIHLAEDLGMPNTQITIPFEELTHDGELWTRHIWSMESPFMHKDAIGKSALHGAISMVEPAVQHIMSGTGSDQLNGGLVRWFIDQVDESAEVNWNKVMNEIRTEMLRPIIGHQYDTFWGSRNFLHPDFLASLSYGSLSEYPWPGFVRGCLHANHYVLMWDELRAGSWHHRGVRFPFMDYRFVPFILSVPRSLHAELFFDKQILRRGAKNHLPAYLTHKPKAPVIKPGEDRRMDMYKDILLGKNGMVMDMLMESLHNTEIPVDRSKFEAKVKELADEPDQAAWAYTIHLAGLILLDQLPGQDESYLDMNEYVMPHVKILKSNEPAIMSMLREELNVPSQDDVLDMPLSFAPGCSMVSDIFTQVHFLVKDGEMSYELDEDNPDWQMFLRSVDGTHSANEICGAKNLSIENFREFLQTTLEEGILTTLKSPVSHASA